MTGSISPSRRAAFSILHELASQPKSQSGELLHGPDLRELSPADRNLTTTLVMGVLRWRIALERRIAEYVRTPPAEPVKIALEMGAFQLLMLDRIPAHAAISESVELARHAGHPHAAGMVNAVLRRLTREDGAKIPQDAESDQTDRSDRSHRLSSAEQIADRYAHPKWMVERWVRFYGRAKAEAICRYNQSPPEATVRLISPDAEEALRTEGIVFEPGAFVERCRRIVQGDVTGTEAYAAGLVRIQDEGSQLIAELAGRGNDILDCCAAPGGKTAILAERNPEAHVTACDINAHRLRAMRSLLRRSPGSDRITYHGMDSSKLPAAWSFDLVLCDAPCSGTGTLARNPEIRHRLTPESLAGQHERQVALLSAAAGALRAGGTLLYSTCSLEPEENAKVVEEVLRSHRNLRAVGWRERVEFLESERVLRSGTAECLVSRGMPEGILQTLPGTDPCDGFFVALLTK